MTLKMLTPVVRVIVRIYFEYVAHCSAATCEKSLLKRSLQKLDGGVWSEFVRLRKGKRQLKCGYHIEQCCEFLVQLVTHQLFWKASASCSHYVVQSC